MRRSIRCTASLVVLATVAAMAFSSAAFAHPGHPHLDVAGGFAHPLSGLDHLLAMVAVGLWAAQLGGRALWLMPLTFVATMTAGAALGIGGMAMPIVEIGIAASVLVLGAMVALRLKPSLTIGLPVVAAFAALHGYAHGVELPTDASGLAYGAGFIAATFALHLVGIALGLLANRAPMRFAARTAGGAIACVGLLLVVTH
jgi:urease accessory protein